MEEKPKRKAIFSLSDQENALTYARELIGLGWKIIATSETRDLLKENNVPVEDISDFFKIKDKYPFPPTLHPFLELILTTEHVDAVDLVYVTTYPLSKGNDIGGHAILALAAKGRRIVISDKKDMGDVIQILKMNNNEISQPLRRQLIDKVYAKAAKHYLSLIQSSETAENTQIIIGAHAASLSEGENPYQVPSDLFRVDDDDALALSNFRQASGDLPCYTNMADLDCLLQTLCLVTSAFIKRYEKVPNIAIAAKHGNSCGLAIDWSSPEIAVENALSANPIAIFGGEVIVNFSINKKLAELLVSSSKRESSLGDPNWSLDLIVAQNFEQEAIEILKNRKRLKLFKNENLTRPYLGRSKWSYRMVRGGFLRQPPGNYILDFGGSGFEFSLPDSNCLDSLIIAWATAWTSFHGGNEVAIAKDRMLLSAAGGPATIDACHIAIDRAKRCGRDLQNSVFAADAFFPFRDAPEELIKAGCAYGIAPKGGKNFEEIKGCFKKHSVGVYYLPEQFRGFCRH